MFNPFFDLTMLILIPGIIFSLYAQGKVKSTFTKYSRVVSSSGMTGAEVAQRLLNISGLSHVRIERVSNTLGDHYDPRTKVLRLSPEVYSSNSLAALGVAAHETGHAIQHDTGYAALSFRNALVPVANFGSKAAFPILLIGILFSSGALVTIGIYAFVAVVVFYLVTLPVEFNASSRAIVLLEGNGFVAGQEAVQTKKVLDAAALTYVAAALTAVLSLLRLILISRVFGDD